jgi:hypothetical protein
MPIYYLHVFNEEVRAEDEEGADLPDLAAALKQAISGIRSILSEEVLKGELNLRGRVEIAGENGDVLRTVPYADAVTVTVEVRRPMGAPAARAAPIPAWSASSAAAARPQAAHATFRTFQAAPGERIPARS